MAGSAFTAKGSAHAKARPERPTPPSGRTRVVLLSHEARAAQSAAAALLLAIADHPTVAPDAIDLQPATDGRAVRPGDLCLLLSWEESPEGQPDSADLSGLQAHQGLRRALLASGQAFTVLRGALPQQIEQALAALARTHPGLMPARAQTLGRPGWQWLCDKCDVPECEQVHLRERERETAAPVGQAQSKSGR